MYVFCREASEDALHFAGSCLEAPDLLLLDEPTNHLDARVGPMARAVSEALRGRRARRDARPLLPRQRRRVDLRGRPRAACTRTRATTPRIWRRRPRVWPPRASSEAKLAKTHASASSSGYGQVSEGAPGEEQGPSGALRAAWTAEARSHSKKVDFTDIHIPVGPRLGDKVLIAEHLQQGLRRTACSSTTLSFEPAAQRHRGRYWPQRRGQVDAVQDALSAKSSPASGDARSIGETVPRSRTSTRTARVSTATKRCGRSCPTALIYMQVGETEVPSRAYVVGIRLQGLWTSSKPAGVLSGGERNRLNLGAYAQAGRQPAVARRAHQRPRRRDAGEPRRGPAWNSRAARLSRATTAWFLDRIATHILAWEGTDENPGNWFWFEGNFD